ncbi:hypothetical protein [Actinoplanes teichomyceticus]|uniref:Integral membrane protein n=1 Tax=Actinoplanes teichomyceticus TaxID=1867 RepID=A0A561WP31_ACTTI|nr:hypothetical protein [Actinoplanes teichomyceticus]TWG25593.1 hypothetical protein FHX34_101563 [Actinoplanes teichomyceticus]GIF10665.1 membrane protein [Actinoplanes teichomyceticus]
MADRTRTRPRGAALGTGLGRVLLLVYGTFALSASARALVQISTHFAEAPLAYLLSALAGVVYLAATVGLAVGGARGRLIALVSCTIELVGVLVVGTLSIADRVAFPDDTVWSRFGSGYGYVPLVLPFVGLWWIWRHRPEPAGSDRS